MAATNVEVWQQSTVLETRTIATDIRRIVLSPDLPQKAAPGSHIDVILPIDGNETKRSYSVVESNEEGTRLVISVFRTPASRGGSVLMHALKPGDTLQISQPLQNFPLRVGARRYVLLAGGIGITAVMAMALVLKNLKADYTLVHVARSRSAMAYLPELRELHGDNFVAHIDDEAGSFDVAGLVGGLDTETEMYMCGPIRLMDAVRRAWSERGLSLPNLRYETFGNSGWFNAEEFIVKVPSLGLEVAVGQGRSMLQALEDAGADMMFDCRKGECGLCEVRILKLEGAIDHRDVFYSARQRNATEKMTCCVSRAVNPQAALVAKGTPPGPAVVTIQVS